MKRTEWTPTSLLSSTRRLLLTTPSPSDGFRSAPATRSMWAVRCVYVPFVLHARCSFRRPRRLDGVSVSPQFGLHGRLHPRQCSTTTTNATTATARSAAELAFEAAMYGEPAPVPAGQDASTAEADRGKAGEGVTGENASGLESITEASVVATAARPSSAGTVASATSASLPHSTPADDRVEVPGRLQASSAVLRTSGAEGQAAQQAMHSTEEAFEQALYSAYFESSQEPKSDSRHASGALPASVVDEGATEDSVELAKAAPGARSGSGGNVALSEAAFARALYGFEEPEIVMTPTDVAPPLAALQNSTQVEEDPVAPSPPHAVVEDVATAATASEAKETAPFRGGGALEATAADAATSTLAEVNHEEHVEHLSAEPDTEHAGEEEDSLFEADPRESEDFFAAPKTTVQMVEETVVAVGDDSLGGAAAAAESKRARLSTRATAREAPELELAHPPPPPTVSMTCPFILAMRDVADDAHALRDALFGVADFHTRVVTHLDPADRVAMCMPLFDRGSKWALFYESGWLMQLQAQENAWISGAELGKATAAVATAYEEAGNADAEGREGSPIPLEAEVSSTVPCTHREVVGRSKVLRCLVYRLLRVPHLWWDEVLELAEAAVQRAQRHGLLGLTRSTAAAAAATATQEVDRQQEADTSQSLDLSSEELQAAMSRVFGTHPLSAHFFSAALERELVALLHDSTAAHPPSSSSAPLSLLSGPVAAWRAFVLAHRLSATTACGPHVKPFSYGEFRPTITAAELAPLQYCQERASWPSPSSVGGAEEQCSAASSSSRTPAEPAAGISGGGGDSSTTATPWSAMGEREQNAFLFGDQSAQLTAKIRSSDGIFLVYGQDGMNFEEEERFTAAEEALRQAAQAEDEEGEEGEAQVRGLSPLEQARAEEMARVRLYDVDRVVLELTAAEARHADLAMASASFLRELSVQGSGSSSRRGRGVRSPVTPFHLHLQNREDVQLATLWNRFVHARTGDLLDNLVHVQRHAEGRLREAAAEMVVQAAFWLLFHSRDEVRAVTDPRRTYETVWGLHEHLMELLRMRSTTVDAHGDAATAAGVDALAQGPPPSQRCAFESLALSSQVSYSCFGVAHVPLTSATAVKMVSEVMAEAVTEGPAELYETLANHHHHHHSAGQSTVVSASTVQEEKEEEFDIDAVQLPCSYDFNALSPLQQLAVGFGFSRSTAEAMEATVGQQEKSSVPLSTDEGGIDKATQVKEGLFMTPIALRSQSRRRRVQIAQWVAQAEAHRAAEYTAATMATAAVQRLLDASARRRDRSPAAAAATSSHTGAVTAAVVGERDGDENDRRAAREPDGDDAAGTSTESVEGGFLGLRNEAAALTPVRAEALAQEAVRRSEAAQADMHEAVEASLHRCFAALRAAGELPRTSPSSTAAADAPTEASQNAPLFTPVQQATLRGAVDALVAIFYPTAEAPKENAIAETHTGDVEEEAPLLLCKTPPPPRKRGRKPAKVAAIAATASKLSAHDEAAAGPFSKTKRRHPAAVKRDVAEAQPPSEKPRRGRPRRTPSADGTYVKAAYHHSVAYQEKRRRKKEGGV